MSGLSTTFSVNPPSVPARMSGASVPTASANPLSTQQATVLRSRPAPSSSTAPSSAGPPSTPGQSNTIYRFEEGDESHGNDLDEEETSVMEVDSQDALPNASRTERASSRRGRSLKPRNMTSIQSSSASKQLNRGWLLRLKKNLPLNEHELRLARLVSSHRDVVARAD